MKADANLHRSPLKTAPLPKITPSRAKLIKMAGATKIVKLKAGGIWKGYRKRMGGSNA
jgi:hypothetical protein